MRVEIRCINKQPRHDPTERITHVGGPNPDGRHWKLSLDEAIKGVEIGKYDFFVKAYGREVEVVVSTSRAGRKYLRTVADSYDPNNLLSLPECA